MGTRLVFMGLPRTPKDLSASPINCDTMMGGGAHFPPSAEYDADKLRDAYGCDVEEEDDDEPLPNYECQTCKKRRYIEDHTRTAPSYCEY